MLPASAVMYPRSRTDPLTSSPVRCPAPYLCPCTGYPRPRCKWQATKSPSPSSSSSNFLIHDLDSGSFFPHRLRSIYPALTWIVTLSRRHFRASHMSRPPAGPRTRSPDSAPANHRPEAPCRSSRCPPKHVREALQDPGQAATRPDHKPAMQMLGPTRRSQNLE